LIEMGFIQEIVEAIEQLEGLSDQLLSVLLREQDFFDGEFRLIGVENEHLVFSVPKQNRNEWYTEGKPGDLLLSSDKEALAQEVKSKYRLDYYWPPDIIRNKQRCSMTDNLIRHHMEFRPLTETMDLPIVVVHPGYLKTIGCDRSGRIDPEELYQDVKKFFCAVI